MKLIIIILVIVIFGLIGNLIKQRYENECLFLRYIEDFVNYYYSNIALFKNNTVEIINNYIIMQENKNANYNNLFLKNGNLYSINDKILSKYILFSGDVLIIKQFLTGIGNNEYEYEIEKIKVFLNFLKRKKEESLLNLKNKGVLYFKIMLSIGAVLAILIWWWYGCFNFI